MEIVDGREEFGTTESMGHRLTVGDVDIRKAVPPQAYEGYTPVSFAARSMPV
jgi:hypothetical protein